MALLTQREAALALRLSERTLERLRVQGLGPKYVKLRRRVLYDQRLIEEWIARRTVASTSETVGVVR